MDTHLDLLYSNSIWRQSSIPTSILMEELSSGNVLSVCTTISISLLISFILLLIVARRKYLNRSEWRNSATFCTSQRDTTHCTFRFWLHAAILLYTTSQKFLNSKIFNVLLNKPAFIWSKVQQKQYNFVIFLLFKRTISYYSISVSYYFFISIWIYYKI